MARKSYVATIVYPENYSGQKSEIISLIDSLHIDAYMSPLHAPVGKKEHYHVMLFFGSLKSDKQISEIIEKIGGVGIEDIINPRAYARYLCHLDSKDKEKYSVDDVFEFGSIEHYSDYISNKDDKRIDGFSDVIKFCRDYNMTEWCQLIDYCVEFDVSMLKVVLDNAYIIREYLKSKKFA